MDRSITPRLLTASEAAAYFRLPVTRFRRLRLGEVSLGAKVLYDRHALDAYLDHISGLGRSGQPISEADAALARFVARPRRTSRNP
ncbi:hypothetical protein [Phenylobacterium sp.]|uniref:hypothetical protein n=1 Tax=Phenylobacterium sp. TaxID=1871053 RepID=UPI002BB3426A|nr:hypothetical protein [Phenylobacterium sp.]HVI34476.1 hypothetical protein [Phenylobacterium sp.]